MHTSISLLVAAERARDMQNEATWARRVREARLARARRAQSRRVRVPDSYEEFLCQTAEAAMREPTASGRADGQTVR